MQVAPNKKKYTDSKGNETAYYFVEHEGGGISGNILVFMHGYTSNCASSKAKDALGKAIGKKIDGVTFDFLGMNKITTAAKSTIFLVFSYLLTFL